MKIRYSRKAPDRSRNKTLAGKTVYSRGMNVVYDENGYPTKSWNPHHPNYVGTTKSLVAQPIEDALAGKEWIPPDAGELRDWNGGDSPNEDDSEEKGG